MLAPRSAPWLCGLSLGLLAQTLSVGLVAAQDGDAAETMTSTLIFADESVSPAEATYLNIGIRRALRQVEQIRFSHLMDNLRGRPVPESVPAAVDDLDLVAGLLRDGDGVEAGRRIDGVLAEFEANLEFVRRSELLDAYMLRGLSRCMARRGSRACKADFGRVVHVREQFEYDTERYPPEFAPVFEEVRESILAEDARGSIEIDTEPPGLEVFVDGRSYGPAPAAVAGVLTGGHFVTIRGEGHEKRIQIVRVDDDPSQRVLIELERHPRWSLVEEFLPGVRQALGASQVSTDSPIARLLTQFGLEQVLVATIEATPAGNRAVGLYLYDLNRRLLRAKVEGESEPGPPVMAAGGEITRQLFQRAAVAASLTAQPQPDAGASERGSLFEQWWFWTAVGVVAVSGAAVTVGVLSGGSDIPEGFTRIDGSLR